MWINHRKKLDIIAVTKKGMDVDSNNFSNELRFSGYSLSSVDRHGRCDGVAVVYVKKSIAVMSIHHVKHDFCRIYLGRKLKTNY